MAVTSMNTKGPKKKKQHYVPKFYLRGFCGSGDTVFALDKESGGIFTPSVGDFCAERYLYESLSNDPNWYKGKFVYPNYTEDGLCELESAFAPVLKRVADLCVPNAPFTCVGDDDARIIASFVANAIARHPSVFKPLRNELMLSASEEDLSPYRDLMRALGHEGAFEGVAAEGVTRRLLLDTGDGSYQGLIVGELLEMEGIVLRAPGCASFATASFPVLPVVRETGGRDRLSSLYCPISPNAAVIYGPGPRRGMGGCELLGARDVVRLNAAYFEADFVRFVVAKDRRTLEEARSFAEAKRPSPPSRRSI